MEENNNDERSLLKKGKEFVENQAKAKIKQKVAEGLGKILSKILPLILKFFLILLAIGVIMAGIKLIHDTFKSILGIFNTEENASAQSLVTIGDYGEYKTNVKEVAQQILDELERQKVNNEVTGLQLEDSNSEESVSLDTKSLKNMIEEYLRVEIKTSNLKTDNPYNEEDGIIVVKRAGIENPLKYVPYDSFCASVENQSNSMLECFSINPDTFNLCIARKNDSVVTKYFDGTSETTGGGLVKEEINYKKYVKNNSTPLNFLITLHLISQDVDFMKDVIKLALGEGKINPIELTYVDTKYESTTQNDYRATVETTDSTTQTTTTEGTLYNEEIGEYIYLGYHTKTTTRYTYNLYVTNADTWLTSTSKTISENPQSPGRTIEGDWTDYKEVGPITIDETDNETDTDSNTETETDTDTDTNSNSNSNSNKTLTLIIEKKVTVITSTTEYSIVDKEKQIKVDEFVELIKKYPKVENRLSTAPSTIFYLLHEDQNTLWHERVMRYVLYKLTDIDYGVLEGDLDSILRGGLNKVNSSKPNILQVAQEIHDAQMEWTYEGNINLLNNDIDDAINSSNKTSSATYVSSVLYKTGYFTKEEMETSYGGVNFNSPVWVHLKLQDSGWEKITDAFELKKGDIICSNVVNGNPTHVQIYAGDNKSYNANSQDAISGSAPQSQQNWETEQGEWWAYRPPNLGQTQIDEIPGAVLELAQKIHDSQRDWVYTNDYKKDHDGDGGLIYWDIESSFNNPKKVTCCSTFVSQVLYKAGYFSKDIMNDINYNYQVQLDELLDKSGWKKIEQEEELQPGDIVFLDKPNEAGHHPTHVQIYAGNYTWYNAGRTPDIQGTAPVERKNWLSWGEWTEWWAYRPPVVEQK